jgi:hypothetical protein
MVGMMNFGCRFDPSRHRRRTAVDELEIVLQHDARHRGHGRDDLLPLELGKERPHELVLHRLVNEMDVHEPGRIGDCRVAAVEDANLHQLKGRDVGDELDADLLQCRPPLREIVLEHPLPELLAEDRPAILHPELVARDGPFAIGRGRRDAVDHGIGKGHVLVDPVGEARVRKPRQANHGIGRDVAVVGDIVAAHDGEGRDAVRLPQLQSGHDQAEHGLRRIGVAAIRDDVGVIGIEPAAAGVDEVAAFGDRHRYDSDCRVGQPGDD